jgi:hypothetical protein
MWLRRPRFPGMRPAFLKKSIKYGGGMKPFLLASTI